MVKKVLGPVKVVPMDNRYFTSGQKNTSPMFLVLLVQEVISSEHQ